MYNMSDLVWSVLLGEGMKPPIAWWIHWMIILVYYTKIKNAENNVYSGGQPLYCTDTACIVDDEHKDPAQWDGQHLISILLLIKLPLVPLYGV